MAYIGAEPLPGQNREVDDISSSFNGSTTAFTLQVNGLNVSPETANNILVNIGGVIQNPGTDYTIAASTITFTTAPASGLSFFAIILGAGINTATVADDTIGPSKLIDTAVTAGSYTTADITVDAQGRITAAANGTIATAEIADGAVNNAKVNASAAIAGTKISPDFGSQNIVTTGGLTVDTTTLKVDASNNRVGIGTASPVRQLEVNFDSANTFIRIQSSDTGNAGFEFGDQSDTVQGAIFQNSSDNSLRFNGFNNAERMRIDSSGNVMIGLTSTSNKFHVEGTTTGSRFGVDDSASGITALAITNEVNADFEHVIFTNKASFGSSVNIPICFHTNGKANEKMRIDSSGKVGIGTTNPETLLDVARSSTTAYSTSSTTNDSTFRILNSGAAGHATMQFQVLSGGTANTGQATISAVPEAASSKLTSLTFGTRDNSGGAPAERMRIAGNGSVLIGRTSASSYDNLLQTKSITVEVDADITGMQFNRTDSNAAWVAMRFRIQGNQSGYIQVNTSSVTYSTSSDYRLKENVVSISDGITRLKQLKPYRFNFKNDSSTTLDGFYAHEASEVVPESVVGTKDAVDAEGNIDAQGIDQSKLVPLLTAALQEAITKIETLETKVAALEAA